MYVASSGPLGGVYVPSSGPTENTVYPIRIHNTQSYYLKHNVIDRGFHLVGGLGTSLDC